MNKRGRVHWTGVLLGVLLVFLLAIGALIFFSGRRGQGGGDFVGMPVERDVGKEAFGLEVQLSPEEPKAGDQVTVAATVQSNTAPHTRVQLRFLVDGKVAEEMSGVIPPQRAETADFTWPATAGRHELRVELASARGVKLQEWATELEF